MNLNNNCNNLIDKYVNNDENFESCLRNVFSVECPKTLEEIKDPSEKLRCEEQFKFIGWKDTNKCWFPEYNGMPINDKQFNKLSKKDRNQCNKLFKASYLNLEQKNNPTEYKPWNSNIFENKNTIHKRKGRLCPRSKEKYMSINNLSMRSECTFVYEDGRVDETGAGGCGIFDNEWLGCGEDQHYNTDCTKCIND
jgi:hypothetical protein